MSDNSSIVRYKTILCNRKCGLLKKRERGDELTSFSITKATKQYCLRLSLKQLQTKELSENYQAFFTWRFYGLMTLESELVQR